ncbi:hypothetical protein SSX86_011591 [Deinandra increscens subsp. villosa]|uniref:Uncharacterized protein n=1 Tax=Deinandra increscens subsp. villosa TaxID=3103831 RepID=A0AAP0H2V8_9ASTR
MSLASIQYMATIPNSSSNTAAANFRFCATKPATIRCAQSAADGPLRRPSIATKPSSIPPPPPPETATAAPQNSSSSVTLEFQRQRAKELQEYFKQKKLEEANQGPFFGFIAKNEISNGRLHPVAPSTGGCPPPADALHWRSSSIPSSLPPAVCRS